MWEREEKQTRRPGADKKLILTEGKERNTRSRRLFGCRVVAGGTADSALPPPAFCRSVLTARRLPIHEAPDRRHIRVIRQHYRVSIYMQDRRQDADTRDVGYVLPLDSDQWTVDSEQWTGDDGRTGLGGLDTPL